jgi:hypothetical protein
MKLKAWLKTVSNSVKSRGFGSGQGMAEAIPGHYIYIYIYIYMKGKCIKNKELKKILKGYISKKIVARHI